MELSEVLEGLYIGNLTDSKNAERLKKLSITHIISIHDTAKPYFKDISYLCLEVTDSPHQWITDIFGESLEYIHRARAAGGNVLVHCLAGVSRSATIIAAYLLARTDLTLHQALLVISAVRSCTNPNHGFRRQLEDWTRQQRKELREFMKMWPEVPYDDQKRCRELLALYSGELDSDSKPVTPPEPTDTEVSTDTVPSDRDESSSRSNHSSTAGSGSGSNLHVPLIMGNASSIDEVNTTPTTEVGNKKPDPPSRLERVRSVLRKSMKRKQSKETIDKNRKNSEDKANNNGVVTPPPQTPNGIHYSENITRSSTLPSHIHKISGDINNIRITSLPPPRLLPAYKTPPGGLVGNIQNRQRIMSSPAYGRSRTNSQSSNYSHRVNTGRRVTTTHIPSHIDKRLVRSRSVGIIPDSELRMRRTDSASVVKLADCEDWIV